MNSLDLYDFTDPVAPDKTSLPSNAEASSSSSSLTATAETSQPSLNEEVTQVMGQLGRLWGGVRKQSQTAFESARKDIGQVVTQAQKEIEKLGQRSATATEDTPLSHASDEKAASRGDLNPESASEGSTTGPPLESTPAEIPASSGFLSRLQSSLPPNLTPTALSSTLQRHLPENLQHGLNLENANADFTQLRATLTENIQRVQQGTTVQQAEKVAEQYMHKGEVLFKEAGEFLKDAVKVVPPEEGGEATGAVWDGTDVWTMPSPIQTNVGRGSRKGKDRESNVLFSVPRAAAKRADVLLKRLRNDPELVRKDPELDEDAAVKDLWSTFISQELDAQGGIGGEVWTKRVSTALEGHDKDEDAKALTALRDQLVPADLTNDIFWTRYFFRVHQIEREEERRKALLAGANQDDDDFTWDEEDDGEDSDEHLSHSQAETSAVTPVNTSSSTVNAASENPSVESGETATPAVSNAPSSTSQTPVSVSPRESEDSYDVVSSGNVSSTGGTTGEKKIREGEKGGENGDDSDWE